MSLIVDIFKETVSVLNDTVIEGAQEVLKAYTEGIYADTPANRKLGRVGMTYNAWADLQKQLEEKKRIQGGHPEYRNYSAVEAALKDFGAHNMKTIKLVNGNKILCRYDSKRQSYSAVIVNEKFVTQEVISTGLKKEFISQINKYLNKTNTTIGNPPKKDVKLFHRPTDKTLTEEEQKQVDAYWEKNRSNYALSNVLAGNGTYAYRDGFGNLKSPSQRFVNGTVPYISDGETWFEDRRRYFMDFEDCTLDQLNKALKDAIPEGMSKKEQEEFKKSLFWGNILRASGEDNFESDELHNRFRDPSAIGKKYTCQVDPQIIEDKDGNITGIKIEVDIIKRQYYKYIHHTEFTVKGNTLKQLSDNYFATVRSILMESQKEYGTRPDTVFYSAMGENNVFAGQRKFFYQGYEERKAEREAQGKK